MNLQPANLLFAAGMAVYIVIRSYFQRSTRTAKTVTDKSSGADRLLVVLVVVGQIVLPAEYVFSAWLDSANYRLPMVAHGAGLVFLASGLWMFWRSHVDLGQAWSVTLEIREKHHLVTRGLYRRIRHPMYASFFLLAFAQACLLGNRIAGWSGLLAVLILYVARVPNEEAMMRDAFGAEYQHYVECTGGVVPRLR